MTDINEAIARWMNEPTEEYECPMCYRVYEVRTECHGEPARTMKCGPRYTHSLDMQVPVWEALAEKHDANVTTGLSRNGRGWASVWFASEHYRQRANRCQEAAHPAEAAARAIYEAIKALGGSHD